MPGQRLSESQARYVANIAAQAKRSAGLSNGVIAHKAGYTEKTIREVINGHCRVYKTVRDVCAVLRIDLDDELARDGLDVSTDGHAPAQLGGYPKASHLELIGRYLTVRPTYKISANLRCYRTELDWDVGRACLRFREFDRKDAHCQTGDVYIPRGSAFFYLLTLDKGWVRTVTISHPIDKRPILRGLIMSQYNISGNNYAPVCAPIVYVKDPEIIENVKTDEIAPSDPYYQTISSLLNETISEGFVKLCNSHGAAELAVHRRRSG